MARRTQGTIKRSLGRAIRRDLTQANEIIEKWELLRALVVKHFGAFGPSLTQEQSATVYALIDWLERRYPKVSESVRRHVLVRAPPAAGSAVYDPISSSLTMVLTSLLQGPRAPWNDRAFSQDWSHGIQGLRAFASELETKLERLRTADEDSLGSLEEYQEYLNLLPPPVPEDLAEMLPTAIKRIVKQANGCYWARWYDACGTMLRKAIQSGIVLRFEIDEKTDEITEDGETVDMPRLLERAKQSRYITPQQWRELKNVKWIGDTAAHSYRIRIRKSDVEGIKVILRLALENMFSGTR